MEIAYFYPNLAEICSQRLYLTQACIGSDNALAPNRRQSFIWTKDGVVYWRIYVSFDLDKLPKVIMVH